MKLVAFRPSRVQAPPGNTFPKQTRSTGVSIRLIEQVWNLKLRNEGERLVLLALADNANDEGTHCFPSQRRIAWKTEYSVPAVSAIIKRLEKKGLVEVLNKGNQHRPTNYALHLEKGATKEAFVPSSWGGDRNDPTKYASGKSLEREQAFRQSPKNANPVDGEVRSGRSSSEPRLERCEVNPDTGELHLDASELQPGLHDPSVQPSVQPSVEPPAELSSPVYKTEQTDTSREGQIQNLKEIPTSGVKKIVLTVNGCKCKAFGRRADRILALFKNGEYIHVNGYLETSEYGTDFVIREGWRLQPIPAVAGKHVSPRVHPETGFAIEEEPTPEMQAAASRIYYPSDE